MLLSRSATLPPPARAAGQHAAGGHGQAQLLAVHPAAKARRHTFFEHVAQHARLEPRRVAVDQEEKGMRIDYIMSNKKRLIKSHQVIFDQDRVSDHYGIILEEAI
jgi:endonuclease/exonuclease/phosphatase family metal-dependent hydrolase